MTTSVSEKLAAGPQLDTFRWRSWRGLAGFVTLQRFGAQLRREIGSSGEA